MESELLPDKDTPPVPIKTYQWEDLRRAREAGGYPWTHLLKAPLQGEITAEDIIRETTPRRSMSREFSRSRTHSLVDNDVQRILNLDSSPGSSRKHGEEGEDEGVHIPKFSKEVSLDDEETTPTIAINRPASQASGHLLTSVELPKVNVSPKSILKRRVPEQQYNIGVQETREKTKCCHPLVNKIKHLADKTLHKLERNENERSPVLKRKKIGDTQEIRQLKSSPGAVRRQKFSAIKLGDSDEMSKTMAVDTPSPKKKKEHIYEDIEESKDKDKSLQFAPDLCKQDAKATDEIKKDNDKENEGLTDQKSIASQDPSLIGEEEVLKSEEHVMEKLHKMDKLQKLNKIQKLHKMDNIIKEAVLLDEEMDQDEPNVDEIFQNQLDERRPNNESPNITITEITDEDGECNVDSNQLTAIPIESSPSPSPHDPGKRNAPEWSRPSSDHEYEIIEKPSPNIAYTAPSVDEKPTLPKNDDELSSTTSLERKYLQHTSDEEEQTEDKENTQRDKNSEGFVNAEALQKDIEDRFFVNTPSTPSRTECEISTSQVDSSALEQLPLKRDSRTKNAENTDSKIQKRFRESTGKLKTQAGKLKTKIQNMKMPDRPNITFPERPKFKLPPRPKVTLPARPKLQNLNLSEKWSGARKKFTLSQRPKFNVPELPKFKMPERPKINFPSLSRKKSGTVTSGSATDVRTATVDFEAKTYPRPDKQNKTELTKTSSSPTLNREDTPPPTFTFTRFKKNTDKSKNYIPDSPEQPREYGRIDDEDNNFQNEHQKRRFDTTYDFDKLTTEYMDDEPEENGYERNPSITDISPSKQEYTPVITEINNDEFFVRPRGISREDIQVREYLSDETRQAFQVPKNVLALLGSDTNIKEDNLYMNDPELDADLMMDGNEAMRYSSEDLNDKDDGYYTFPPIRPSRAKRKKKEIEAVESEPTPYIDESVNASMQFSDVDLGLSEDHTEVHMNGVIEDHIELAETDHRLDFTPTTDLHSIHEYANDDVIQYPENVPIQSQTLPQPPKRKKKFGKKDLRHSSLNDFRNVPVAELWEEPGEQQHNEDIIVYRTEHEYIVPPGENVVTEHSPLPPRRNRSRSSRGTSLCDDDRTSHGAESLILDTHIPQADDLEDREIRHESPGYATVDKGYIPPKGERRSLSKTPPTRRRKSNSSERKYYTVGSQKNIGPDRPPRKKSSTSLMTLNSFNKRSVSGDITQYVEIDEPFDSQKDLKSGDIVNKMKDRPLPPPPRPPRGSKKLRKDKNGVEMQISQESSEDGVDAPVFTEEIKPEDVVEIEVSTQTDPLPDDVDFELGLDENLDMSMSSSLRDIVDEESILLKSHTKLGESPRTSRPTSRSEKSFKLSDPKISEHSKLTIGRTSPTVILVEKRVSSPTRINEREEMLTEASLTVQHIDIEKSQIPDVPPLPRPRTVTSTVQSSKNTTVPIEERAIERASDATRDVQLDNLVTQRLQVRDLDVGRLNVSELQANKILVSDIEGMTLQVTELDSKSGHLSVSGIEFSPSVIDEIVKKFAEISTNQVSTSAQHIQVEPRSECPRPVSREEQTQTEEPEVKVERKLSLEEVQTSALPRTPSVDSSTPPQRPPPPDLTPLLYSYLQDITIPPASFYPPRSFRERPFTEFHESQHQTPPPPMRRQKRKPAAPHSGSSSEDRPRPSPRRVPAPVKAHEPTIVEAGAQFLRVCHTSISRTIRSMFNSLMAYISNTEDKRDIQMAMVIFLVAVHHHHWEFFNPPDGKQ
ncbi:hypothetical protein K1T71_000045 [Dendrolimus kikuchii]|uniref:Uncharacterized protein n=1 Tax=Dendrolimus kikuchii TaxID=765133 RepID=A0ACC1DJN5_9NEOP|nr:hypothetical protein K1T71_000045 [Dendrolimus kikuchii]